MEEKETDILKEKGNKEGGGEKQGGELPAAGSEGKEEGKENVLEEALSEVIDREVCFEAVMSFAKRLVDLNVDGGIITDSDENDHTAVNNMLKKFYTQGAPCLQIDAESLPSLVESKLRTLLDVQSQLRQVGKVLQTEFSISGARWTASLLEERLSDSCGKVFASILDPATDSVDNSFEQHIESLGAWNDAAFQKHLDDTFLLEDVHRSLLGEGETLCTGSHSYANAELALKHRRICVVKGFCFCVCRCLLSVCVVVLRVTCLNRSGTIGLRSYANTVISSFRGRTLSRAACNPRLVRK